MLRVFRYRFSIYSNQHQQIKEIINGKEYSYDHNVHLYPISVQAYLQKRWTKKEEIPPKIYIIKQIPEVKGQHLQPLKRLLDQHRLERMFEYKEINTQYIHSIVFEEHFKPMLDEYLAKVVLDGSTVPLIKFDQYESIRQRILNLYKVFFQGDEQTQLEQEIEFKYLALKQRKFFKYTGTQKQKDKCIWTYSQQRRVENMINWRSRDVDLYDDFRPIYEPISIDKKLEACQLLLKIDQATYWNQIIFHLLEKKKFLRTKARVHWVAQTLFTRVMLYTNSFEFIRVLGIPPDFHIELSLVNIHIWLIIDRLKQMNTRESNHLATLLNQGFVKYTQQQVSKIHLRKKNEFVKDIQSYMSVTKNYLEFHFNRNAKTMVNHYVKLDALVWSIVFFEKVPRYSDQVYLFTEYLKNSYDYLQTLDYQTFDDANIEFDVYKIGLDFKQKIMSVNPPLTAEEFEKEYLSENPVKKYYYSYNDVEMEYKQIDKQLNQNVLIKRLIKLNYNLLYVAKKYQTLDTYDHFSNHEEQLKQEEEKKKYIWTQKTEKDPQELQRLLKQRRLQQ